MRLGSLHPGYLDPQGLVALWGESFEGLMGVFGGAQRSRKPCILPAMTTRIAACSCGQLTASVSGEPVRISICHCLACQRRTGSVFGAQAWFPAARVQVQGTSSEYVRIGDEGTHMAFHFCPHCGATVHAASVERPDVVAIPVGAFADPGFPAPSVSVYEERMHPWVGLPDAIAHLA